jgi:hypothetical protein
MDTHFLMRILEDQAGYNFTFVADPQLLQGELKKVLATMPTPFPLEIAPFVGSDRYAELIKARREAAAKGDYWPGYPEQDWERFLNLNLKSPEELYPLHHSAWQPGTRKTAEPAP